RSAELIRKFGPYPGSDLMIEPTLTMDKSDVDAIADILRPSFDKCLIVPPYDESPMSWPEGPNHMFRRAVKWVQESEYDYFYFWEPDCLPLRPGWLEPIKAEYERVCKKTPFMGYIHPTRMRDRAGNISQVGRHMAGTGLYPKFTLHIAHRAATIGASSVAWDVHAADQIVPLAHHTKLIHHTWS